MNGNQVCVILCHPDESGNIGSVCRAMANSAIHDLRIVGKKQDYDEAKIKMLAVHAFDIWQNASFFETIPFASKDCCVVAGTTRRRGKKRKNFLLLPEEFAESVSKISNNAKIALVFGNERTGLTDGELENCTVGVTIPASDEFASLNLSHAVQIVCYTLFRTFCAQKSGYTPITLNRLDKTVDCIADDLQKIGFFTIAGRGDMENFWRGILSRSNLSEGEAKYIEKVFNKIAGLAHQ